MQRHERLYRLYEDDDVERLRQYQTFVDLFPAVDAPAALEAWREANGELRRLKRAVAGRHRDGDALAELAARATREQAFTALDLAGKYGRAANVLVLDVDETLRSAGSTDNEIPRETLHLLTELHEAGVPIVICTGQTLENVKGFAIQGLGSEMVGSGSVAIVYESGNGVFAPGHGPDSKQLLYEGLDEAVRDVFAAVRSRALTDAPEAVRRGCHLQGNEFNVTLKPNHETGSEAAREVVDAALVHVVDLLGRAVGGEGAVPHARAYYAASDPEIRAVLADADALPADPESAAADVPADLAATFERVDVGYYEADAAEITSLELSKVEGVAAAFDVLGIDDPFALVMGDSKSDLRVMEWVEERDTGIAAAPAHASTAVLEHVRSTDGLVFDAGRSDEMLRTVDALRRLVAMDGTD
jgi:HAD superfamily hydrolase (TIGR01484 family)